MFRDWSYYQEDGEFYPTDWKRPFVIVTPGSPREVAEEAARKRLAEPFDGGDPECEGMTWEECLR